MTGSGTTAPTRNPWRQLAVSLAAATALLTAAAVAAPGTAVASRRSNDVVAAARAAHVTDAARKAAATVYARHLLTRLRLPDGSRRMHWKRVAGLSPSLAAILSDVVDKRALFHAPEPMTALGRYLQAHAPAGMTVSSFGSDSDRGKTVAKTVTFSPRHLPAGIYSAMLVTTFKPARGGASLLRADAQVAWYPPRGGAVRIRATDYKSVTVTRARADGRDRTARTLTGKRLARLVAAYNRLYGAPDVVISCPAEDARTIVYRLTFRPANGTRTVVVTPSSCLFVGVTIGGQPEPALYPAAAMITAARRALR